MKKAVYTILALTLAGLTINVQAKPNRNPHNRNPHSRHYAPTYRSKRPYMYYEPGYARSYVRPYYYGSIQSIREQINLNNIEITNLQAQLNQTTSSEMQDYFEAQIAALELSNLRLQNRLNSFRNRPYFGLFW
ncbi:MAG: hypothetical protein UR26_C0004G0055 [candidate division TM6 bacterium GW2011_GWF2_32_72]|nr:MAG: hypothetical protein UR26_C0004G0055 [candidate division TM6 bacterium GW2011_GWF2_32_72]